MITHIIIFFLLRISSTILLLLFFFVILCFFFPQWETIVKILYLNHVELYFSILYFVSSILSYSFLIFTFYSIFLKYQKYFWAPSFLVLKKLQYKQQRENMRSSSKQMNGLRMYFNFQTNEKMKKIKYCQLLYHGQKGCFWIRGGLLFSRRLLATRSGPEPVGRDTEKKSEHEDDCNTCQADGGKEGLLGVVRPGHKEQDQAKNQGYCQQQEEPNNQAWLGFADEVGGKSGGEKDWCVTVMASINQPSRVP